MRNRLAATPTRVYPKPFLVPRSEDELTQCVADLNSLSPSLPLSSFLALSLSLWFRRFVAQLGAHAFGEPQMFCFICIRGAADNVLFCFDALLPS